ANCRTAGWQKCRISVRSILPFCNSAVLQSSAPGGSRTPGLQVRSLSLYPAELRARNVRVYIRMIDVERVNDKAVVFLPWNTIEREAQQQILNTASMPFIFKHVAVMPDCHYGKGATVGTVLATTGAVIPAAVGVDIGCGMIA